MCSMQKISLFAQIFKTLEKKEKDKYPYGARQNSKCSWIERLIYSYVKLRHELFRFHSIELNANS